jgi:hypothetical protein
MQINIQVIEFESVQLIKNYRFSVNLQILNNFQTFQTEKRSFKLKKGGL